MASLFYRDLFWWVGFCKHWPLLTVADDVAAFHSNKLPFPTRPELTVSGSQRYANFFNLAVNTDERHLYIDYFLQYGQDIHTWDTSNSFPYWFVCVFYWNEGCGKWVRHYGEYWIEDPDKIESLQSQSAEEFCVRFVPECHHSFETQFGLYRPIKKEDFQLVVFSAKGVNIRRFRNCYRRGSENK